MNDEKIDFNDEMKSLVADLVSKADITNAKTSSHANVNIDVDGLSVPLRIDDYQLLFICARLLPNILNYLVNILPQFAYPFVVSYLQNLSELRDDPITINELYNYLISLENGNIQFNSEAEN